MTGRETPAIRAAALQGGAFGFLVKPFDDEVFLSLVRTFVAAAGDPDIAQELKNGKQLGDRTYKVHLDGYNQTDMITGKGPSQRHEIFYLTETTLAAVRIDDYKYRFTDQPGGWLGATEKVDWPILVNSGRVGPARSF
jgi:arylsulfatase A-like enzyme